MSNGDIYNMSRIGLQREVCHLHSRNKELEADLDGLRNAYSAAIQQLQWMGAESVPLYPDPTPDSEPAVPEAVNIVFDGPPGPNPPHFVEVETDDGRSVRVGEWIERNDGMWALRIDRAIAQSEHGEQRMVPVYAVPEDVEAQDLTCFTLHDHPPFGADFLTLFRAAPQPE